MKRVFYSSIKKHKLFRFNHKMSNKEGTVGKKVSIINIYSSGIKNQMKLSFQKWYLDNLKQIQFMKMNLY